MKKFTGIARHIGGMLILAVVVLMVAAPVSASEHQLTIKISAVELQQLQETGQSIVVIQSSTSTANLVAWSVIGSGQISETNVIKWDSANYSWYESSGSLSVGAIVQPNAMTAGSGGGTFTYDGLNLVTNSQTTTGSYTLSNTSSKAVTIGLATRNLQNSIVAPISANVVLGNQSLMISLGTDVRIFTLSGSVQPGQVLSPIVGSALDVDFAGGITQQTVTYYGTAVGFVLGG